jgi:hypothetical protein
MFFSILLGLYKVAGAWNCVREDLVLATKLLPEPECDQLDRLSLTE